MVNRQDDSSSSASGSTEDSRGPLNGDLFTGCFGGVIECKRNNTPKIGFQNVGGFPCNKGKIKEDNIRMGLTKWDFDIFGCAETNLDWRTLPEEEKFPFRTREWWDTQHVSYAFNRTCLPSTTHQYGGTAIFSNYQVANRVIDKGYDDTALGWMVLDQISREKGTNITYSSSI
jgi:hypothetical protein